MNSFIMYKNVCTDIECIQVRIDTLEIQHRETYKLLEKNMPKDIKEIDYTGMPFSKFETLSLDRLSNRLLEIREELVSNMIMLEDLQDAKIKIEGFINQYSIQTVYYKVARLYYIENMSLKEIADSLHLSYNHIRHVNGELNKKFKKININVE